MADLLEGVKYDKNGIPILSEEQIEEIALSILFKFDNELIEKCTMVPLGEIVKSLGDKHELKLESKKLPHGKLGYFDVKSVTICIDETTWPEAESNKNNLWRFTLAHELGHFFFHSLLGSLLLEDSTEIFRIFNKPSNVKDWPEWQANTFAAAVLLPKFPFKNFVNERLAKYNIDCFLPSDRNRNKLLYDKTVKEISENFQVSKQVARIRLQKLDFVKPDTAKIEDNIGNISDYLPKF